MYPRRLTPGAQFIAPPRDYSVINRQNRSFHAFRIVISEGHQGEYYGIQGTSWNDPPIIRSPSSSEEHDGQRYMIFRDGTRVRLIAWHAAGALYWISNTLSESLSQQQMIDIARSTKPL